MRWMQQWPGTYPISVADAHGGVRVVDVDGIEYVDLALGDTAAMFGHANPLVVEAACARLRRGATMMLPSEDGVWVGEELAGRFGLPYWQVTTSATDANRFIIRLCRMVTGRDKIITFNWNYHGSVDETQVELDDAGAMVPRTGVHPNAMHHEQTTRLVEFNDVAGFAAALERGDVACVLTEPALTNIGMVPPLPGYHDALRHLTRAHDVPLILDETHTLSTGPGGIHACSRAGTGLFSDRQEPCGWDTGRGVGVHRSRWRIASGRYCLIFSRARRSIISGSGAPWRAARCRWRRFEPR